MNRRKILDQVAIQLVKMDPIAKEHELISGGIGKVIFLAAMYKVKKNVTYYNAVIETIEYIFDSISKKELDFTLSQGFAGIGWVTQYLIKTNILPEDTLEDLLEIDGWVLKSIENDVKKENTDLLYGIIGKGIYFIERYKYREKFSHEALGIILDYLNKIAIKDSYGLSWRDSNLDSYRFDAYSSEYQIEEYIYNMGLAHGIPSIISFLSRLHSLRIDVEITSELLKESSNWVIAQVKNRNFAPSAHFLDENYKHIFPDSSRLAWCYGDLGIAISLFHSSKVLKDKSIYDVANKIATNTTKRLLDKSNVWNKPILKIVNQGFCHGTAGISHIYKRIYNLTENKIFETAASYWLDLTLEQRLENWRGIAGFVRHDLNDDSIYTMTEIDISLLAGVSGIGMVLLSQQYNYIDDWDSIFLTNFNY